ncbi:PRD domain-containing protein [Buttiauxella warmboldiae]|uniref:PRD domain-containing protein n=1 Tax=Buttiauxella warmboldiae TaxID=82993 RepID=A0A3N5ECY9_9ENTR|nr:PRD domain-containing protein [Buttiauxella warmboldiae]RPH29596.1 PRD domain-containing protein [Buttiauxella warmboldiae]
MQAITSRQNRLLKFLLQHREYVTLLKIAQFLNVSEKTIQRDLRELEQWLADRKITINKRSGAGVMLLAENVTDFLQLDLSMGGEGYDVDVMLNNSRRVKIASQLLNETPHETSISKLSERYFISNASIVNDLKIIESWIAPLGLSLIRSQSGTHIEGSENNVRQAIASLINGIINHNEMGAIIHSRLDPGSYKALVHYFDEEDVLFVQRLLQDMEKKLCWSMGEPYYVNIFTHILIMMYRITRGNLLPKKEESPSSCDEKVFNVAQGMLQCIERYIAHPLPEDEVWFIYQYIISSGAVVEERGDIRNLSNMHSSDEARLITKQLIATFSVMVGNDLSDDFALYDGLLIHIKPLINRLHYHIFIRNPLLQDIKSELPDVWKLTQCAVNQVFSGRGDAAVSEDEIGYLTVHFQAAMERQIAHKRVLLVCSTGIGTSHLLKSRILRAFPDWTIIGVVSINGLQAFHAKEEIDLAISTINLPATDLPVVYVSAFFNDADIKRVTETVISEKLYHATRVVVGS